MTDKIDEQVIKSLPPSIKIISNFAVGFGNIDHEAAKKSSFEGIIASGWQTCSFVMRVLVDNYFSPVSSLGSPGLDDIRWIFPVRPGDKLMVRATIIETKLSRSKPDRGIVRTFIETINQQEDIVMSFRSVNFMLCRGSFTDENVD